MRIKKHLPRKERERRAAMATRFEESRRAAMRLFQLAGKANPVRYWIMGLETEAEFLRGLGVELGPVQCDEKGQVKRAQGLVVWGKCKVLDFNKLDQHWGRFVWGPDTDGERMDESTRKQGKATQGYQEPARFDWDTYRKRTGESGAHSN